MRALAEQWLIQAEDYMRLYRSAHCGCSSADRQVYLKVALTLKDCARQLEDAYDDGTPPRMEAQMGSDTAPGAPA
jgi:hypothetical protein